MIKNSTEVRAFEKKATIFIILVLEQGASNKLIAISYKNLN